MAIKAADGFDHYAALADLQSRVGAVQWTDIVGVANLTFVPGRGGFGFCAAIEGSNQGPFCLGGAFNVNYTSAVIGPAVLINPAAQIEYLDYMLMDYTAQAPQFTIRCYPDSGVVLAYTGDPNTFGAMPIASSPPNAFSPFIWSKVELGAVISSSGSFDFHINGNSVLSASGVNTQATANSWFNGFRIRSSAQLPLPIAAFYVDDFLLTDYTTGPGTYAFAGFAGDWAVRTEKTTANSSVQWTPLAGQNWQEVGETQFDGDTTYNYALTVGNSDVFTFGSLPTTTSAVGAVLVTGAYRKLDASAQTIVQKVVSGGTSSNGATLTLSLSWAYYTDLFVLDPHTSATWTPTAVNALTAGYTLNS